LETLSIPLPGAGNTEVARLFQFGGDGFYIGAIHGFSAAKTPLLFEKCPWFSMKRASAGTAARILTVMTR